MIGKNMKKLVVILDNGHGKNTKGKCSPDKSLYEWEWCREITSRLLEECLLNNIEVLLLVPEDKDISLKERVKRANSMVKEITNAGKEALLISVHINAAGGDGKWKTARGWSGWVANCASEKSRLFESILCKHAEELGLMGNRCVPADKCWEANFTIITDTKCPAVLTENLFQDNREDVKFLLSKEGKETIVKLHMDSIKEYKTL